MGFISEFFHTQVPRSRIGQPLYYRKVLSTCCSILSIYFLLSFLLIFWTNIGDGWKIWMLIPLCFFAAALCLRYFLARLSTIMSLGGWAAISCIWAGWYIRMFGWGLGAQHMLIPLLILVFFDIYDPPYMKAFYFFAIIAFRMLLFTYSLGHGEIIELDTGSVIALQTLNSITCFLLLAVCCIIFSTNLQDTERQLRLDNEELQKKAGTDPLTKLPNRRAMLDEMEKFQKSFPKGAYSVAIADIDFFKRVNDTYGHNCGDYTLSRLAALFLEKSNCSVCRWGGEEFCFFLPEKNIDQASQQMMDLNVAVQQMKLSFEGQEFSITVTIGVAENDFTSSMSEILEEADKKLYMGKSSGRNKVVC